MTTPEWPGTSSNVTQWLRSSLRPDDSEFTIHGLDDVRISAALTGSDLEHLTIDASRAKLRFRRSEGTPAPASAPEKTSSSPAVVSRSSGFAHTIRVLADPVRVERIPITLDLQLHNAPIEWQTYAAPEVSTRPESRFALRIADEREAMDGSLVASVKESDLAPLLVACLRPALNEAGIRLRRLSVSVVQDGADGVRIEGKTRIRWKVLGASFTGMTRLVVTPDGVLTVRALQIGSKNPLIALALRAARKAIAAEVGQSHDLNERLGAEGTHHRLHSVRIAVDERITLTARLS